MKLNADERKKRKLVKAMHVLAHEKYPGGQMKNGPAWSRAQTHFVKWCEARGLDYKEVYEETLRVI